jgi:hypothetical protein
MAKWVLPRDHYMLRSCIYIIEKEKVNDSHTIWIIYNNSTKSYQPITGQSWLTKIGGQPHFPGLIDTKYSTTVNSVQSLTIS